jgi:PAS domain S-box-containing protein
VIDTYSEIKQEKGTNWLEPSGAIQYFDALTDANFDNLVELAAEICEVPIATICLSDQNRVFLKSKVGVSINETSGNEGKCLHSLITKGAVEIEDFSKDPAYADSRLKLEGEEIAFYAAYPILSENGIPKGVLCVMDFKAKKLNEIQNKTLEILSKELEQQINTKLEKLQLGALNQKLKKVLSNVGDIVFLLDKTLIIRDYYTPNEKYLKFPPEEFLNKKITDLTFSQAHLELFENLIDKTIVSQKKQSDEYSLEMNGKTEWYKISLEQMPTKDEEILCIVKHISQIKKNEIKNKDREKEYKDFFGNAQGLLLKHDLEGKLLDINQLGIKLLEYSREEILKMNLFDLVVSKKNFNDYLEIIKTKKSFNGLGRLKSKSGEVATFQMNNILFEPTHGATFVLCNGVNISESLKAHDELKAATIAISKERSLLRTIIDNIPINIYTKNTKLEKTLINRSELKYLGATDEKEVLGKKDEAFFNKRTAEESRSEDEMVVKEGTAILNKEVIQENKNSEKRYCLISKLPLKSETGEIIGMVGITSDITHRKKAELDLVENEKRLNAIISSTDTGTWEWNIETNQIIVNRRFWEIIGYDIDEQRILFREDWNELSHPDDLLVKEKKLSDHFNKKTESYQCEIRFRHKDGHWVWVNEKGRIFSWDQQGKPSLMYGTYQDISSTKEFNKQLNEAKEIAENSNKAKSDFLANMSHEIRTPLNGVIGFSDLLMKTQLSDTQLQYAKTVYHSAHSLLDLINDILDFSKIEAGKMDLSIEKVDIFELGTQVSDITKYQAHSKGLELLLNLSPSLPRFVFADDVRLRQILINLLTNAIKFTNEGEVELKVTILDKKIKKDGPMKFRFSVMDTGIGIPHSKQIKIFDAFSQEDASTTRKFGGTGLGLTISNKLLGLMGSKLQLKSEPNKGSTFFFDIDLMAEQGEKEKWPENHGLKKILVVDDNQTNRHLVKEILEAKNINCLEAGNGLEGLSILEKEWPVDLIFMDFRMPFLNGIETIEKVRALKNVTISQVPIVLLSSSNEKDLDKEKLAALDVHYQLIKPIKNHQMIKIFKRLRNPLISENVQEQDKNQRQYGFLRNRSFNVLIAEDNPVNMKLSKIILSKISSTINVIEAENGLMAYEYVIQNKPDLILMDIQMPIMNGYETAKAIRTIDHGGEIPIIALTAGTVKGERERCLESGMNDYISKPLVQDKLTERIVSLLHPEEKADTHTKQKLDFKPKHFDKTHLLSLFDGDKDIGKELLKIAYINLEESKAKLEEVIKSKNKNKLFDICHKLKGSAGTTGFFILLQLTDELEKLEESANNKHLFEIGSKIMEELEYLLENFDGFKL